MLQSCAKISSVLSDGDLPSKADGIRGAAPQSQPHHHAVARDAVVWSDAEGCARRKRKKNQEISVQDYRIGDVLKDIKAHKGCWTSRTNTVYESMFICFKKLLGLNWYFRDWMLKSSTSHVDYYCLLLLASLMVTNSFEIPRWLLRNKQANIVLYRKLLLFLRRPAAEPEAKLLGHSADCQGGPAGWQTIFFFV